MQNSKATIWDGFDRYHWCEECLLTKNNSGKALLILLNYHHFSKTK